jgi:hypothetical protein
LLLLSNKTAARNLVASAADHSTGNVTEQKHFTRQLQLSQTELNKSHSLTFPPRRYLQATGSEADCCNFSDTPSSSELATKLKGGTNIHPSHKITDFMTNRNLVENKMQIGVNTRRDWQVTFASRIHVHACCMYVLRHSVIFDGLCRGATVRKEQTFALYIRRCVQKSH